MRTPRYVYAIKHNRTGKVYVGSTYNTSARFKNHLILLRNNKHPVEDFQADFNEFGEDLTFTILEEFTDYSNKNREYEWMKELRSHIRSEGYNYKDRYNFGEKPPEKKSMALTERERELIKLIRKSSNPVDALKIAVDVITNFLESLGGGAENDS